MHKYSGFLTFSLITSTPKCAFFNTQLTLFLFASNIFTVNICTNTITNAASYAFQSTRGKEPSTMNEGAVFWRNKSNCSPSLTNAVERTSQQKSCVGILWNAWKIAYVFIEEKKRSVLTTPAKISTSKEKASKQWKKNEIQ